MVIPEDIRTKKEGGPLRTRRKIRTIFDLLLPLRTMGPGDDLSLVLFTVLKKRDSLGQYDKFKCSFYFIGMTKYF